MSPFFTDICGPRRVAGDRGGCPVQMAQPGGLQSSDGVLTLFLKAVDNFLTPTVKELKKQHPETAVTVGESGKGADLHSIAGKFEVAYATVLPQYLVKYGFEDVQAFLDPEGNGIPGWTKPLLPEGSRSIVEDAFLAYLAKEITELQNAAAGDESQDVTATEREQHAEGTLPAVCAPCTLHADSSVLLVGQGVSTSASHRGHGCCHLPRKSAVPKALKKKSPRVTMLLRKG